VPNTAESARGELGEELAGAIERYAAAVLLGEEIEQFCVMRTGSATRIQILQNRWGNAVAPRASERR
jgi:hypothetical protein